MARVAVLEEPSGDWDDFVQSSPGASIYLRRAWPLLIRRVFGHRCFFFEARENDGRLSGVLATVMQSSALLGRFMTSLPFINYGGVLAADEATARELMECARDIAQQKGCSYLEFRDTVPRLGEWNTRTDKVGMLRSLPADSSALGKELGAKLRSQIKRAEREQPRVRVGGAELLDDFYGLFCRTMRDLGTPTLKKSFFREVITSFPESCQLLVIDRHQVPAAGGFLIFDRETAEIPWAACRNDAKGAGFNMRLYWEALNAAIDRRCTRFDFGRSTADSGTYRFKQQWGAEPLPLHWHRWGGKKDAAHPGLAMRVATAVWRRLPLPVANVIGPVVSPGLPW